MRQIILDTETTGLRVEEGHRIIEIGCIEMISRKVTRNHFHYYINPQREIEAGAAAVHGITNDFLKDKPTFQEILEPFLSYISGAELIIHNAPFDLSFLNYELSLAGHRIKSIEAECSVIDTLQLARKLHVGQRNSLDALCKRYGIDNSKRDLHGALLDSDLLAQVYLAMTGGQSSFFEESTVELSSKETMHDTNQTLTLNDHQICVLKADQHEIDEHQKYLRTMKERGKCLWLDD